MNLKSLGANQTQVKIGGYTILFSYETPVAAIEHETEWAYKTEKKWSVTTTRHINKWLGSMPAISKPQEYFDNLVSEDVSPKGVK